MHINLSHPQKILTFISENLNIQLTLKQVRPNAIRNSSTLLGFRSFTVEDIIVPTLMSYLSAKSIPKIFFKNNIYVSVAYIVICFGFVANIMFPLKYLPSVLLQESAALISIVFGWGTGGTSTTFCPAQVHWLICDITIH